MNGGFAVHFSDGSVELLTKEALVERLVYKGVTEIKPKPAKRCEKPVWVAQAKTSAKTLFYERCGTKDAAMRMYDKRMLDLLEKDQLNSKQRHRLEVELNFSTLDPFKLPAMYPDLADGLRGGN